MIGNEAVISLVIGAILGVIIPAAAVIVFKLKCRNASLLSMVIGCATFFLFALVLEQILHLVMIPLVQGSTVAYVLYGTLAAGVFEETGRFLVCKFLMKKRQNNSDAVMMGLGHGGIEAVILMGFSMLSMLITALMINSMSFDEFAKSAGANTPELTEILKSQADHIASFTIPTALLTAMERVSAMTLHVSMSVVVMKAVTVKGKLWLYPAAIVIHALFDVAPALYQRKVITEIWLLELILAAVAVVAAIAAFKASKLQNDTVKA